MGLDRRVCKLIQEYFDDENYPPLFQLYVVRYIAFSLAVEIKCDLQVAPAHSVSMLPWESRRWRTSRNVTLPERHMHGQSSSETWVRACAPYHRPACHGHYILVK